MPASQAVLSSELLGYPADAGLLIINVDDFGVYPSVNSAVLLSIENGIASSCSLMPPCPWRPTSATTAAGTTTHSVRDSSHSGLRLQH